MKFNLLKSIALAGFAAGSLWLASSAAMAQEVTLRMHQFLPPQANVPKLVLDVWAKRVEEASGGKIKVVHHHSGALGGEREVAQQIQLGAVDFGPGSASPRAGGATESAFFFSRRCRA